MANPAWVKGVSGNPSGRTKDPIKALAKSFAEEAFLYLVSVVQDEKCPHKQRIQAAVHIIDRAYGKPVQQITSDELSRIREILIVRSGDTPVPGAGREICINPEARPRVQLPDGQSG